MQSKERHPDWYVPIKNMHVLILGSYPPHKKRWDYDFYYPNNQNRFWKVLAKIAKKKLTETEGEEAVLQRIGIMKSLHIGVQNIGLEIIRKRESAADKDIIITKYQNILGIVSKNKKLKTILLAGYSNESSTYHSFMKYLSSKRIRHTKPASIKAGEKFYIYCPKKITCMIANSTSPRAASVTFDMLVDQFKRVLLTANRNK